jgi:hypothetical protein
VTTAEGGAEVKEKMLVLPVFTRNCHVLFFFLKSDFYSARRSNYIDAFMTHWQGLVALQL